MRQKNKLEPGIWVLLIVIFVSIFLCISVKLLGFFTPHKINTEEPTQEPITLTPPVPLITELPKPVTDTPLELQEIEIGDWRILRADCSNHTRDWVIITGVEITGGQPPYNFTFSQNEKLIYMKQLPPDNSNEGTSVNFIDQLKFSTGSYVNVTIESDTQDKKPKWESRLYFP